MRYFGYAIMAFGGIALVLNLHWVITLGLLALGVGWVNFFPIEYPEDFEP